VWQRHRISFGVDQAVDLFRRVARAIPLSKEEGGTQLASQFNYSMRVREDSKFRDERMQTLLDEISESVQKLSPTQTS